MGDAVGRHGDAEKPVATEAELLSRTSEFPIDSDVIIAPHHGADNGSSTEFIMAVNPKWVIFAAGHQYQHPRKSTACRYLNQNVQLKRILRTDWGDKQEGDEEWDHGAADEHDKVGDDDIDIIIGADGTLNVDYRNQTGSGGKVFEPDLCKSSPNGDGAP